MCSYPCVLILTFFDPIFFTMVDVGIFKYIGVSSVFAFAYNSKLFLFLILYYKKEKLYLSK